MSRLKREQYESAEAKQLLEQYNRKLMEDKERKLAQKLVDNIPAQRKQYVLEILSRELAAKGAATK